MTSTSFGVAMFKLSFKSESKNSFLVFALLAFLSLAESASAQAEFRPVGIANAYRFYSGNEIGIEFPLDFNGLLINQNQNLSNLPQKFLLSDGTSKRPFILVDRSPGSPLDTRLQIIEKGIRKILKINSANLSPAQKNLVLKYFAENTNRYVEWPESANNHLPSVAFSQLAHLIRGLPIGQWYETKIFQPIERFENILDRRSGVCIDMALITSLMLERFSVPHRLLFGSVQSYGEVGGGHTWIQLADGRILDVAWKTLAQPDIIRADGWQYFGNQYGKQFRFPYSFFPIISLK